MWFPAQAEGAPRVWKATFGNDFGHLPDGQPGTPLSYLERLLLHNEVFGDDIELEGIWECRPGVLRVVTSQSAVAGTPGEEKEIHDYFEACGFARIRMGGTAMWYRADDGIICADTHGGNLLRTPQGLLVAIDVPVMRAPAAFMAAQKAGACNGSAYQFMMSDDLATPESLVPKILAGDTAAEDALFAHLWNWLLEWAPKFGIRPSEQEDFAIEVAARVLTLLHRFDPGRGRRLSTWVYVVAHNHARDRMRRGKSDPLAQDAYELQEWMGQAQGAEVLEGGKRRSNEEALLMAYASLPGDDRELLNLCLSSQYSAAEIGAKMGMSAGHVRVRKLRLLNKLRDMVQKPPLSE